MPKTQVNVLPKGELFRCRTALIAYDQWLFLKNQKIEPNMYRIIVEPSAVSTNE